MEVVYTLLLRCGFTMYKPYTSIVRFFATYGHNLISCNMPAYILYQYINMLCEHNLLNNPRMIYTWLL